VPKDVEVAPPSLARVFGQLRLRHEAEDDGERDERDRVDHVEDGEAARIRCRRDQPARYPTQPDAEVARHAL
jgi:hypothetical protein